MVESREGGPYTKMRKMTVVFMLLGVSGVVEVSQSSNDRQRLDSIFNIVNDVPLFSLNTKKRRRLNKQRKEMH